MQGQSGTTSGLQHADLAVQAASIFDKVKAEVVRRDLQSKHMADLVDLGEPGLRSLGAGSVYWTREGTLFVGSCYCVENEWLT